MFRGSVGKGRSNMQKTSIRMLGTAAVVTIVVLALAVPVFADAAQTVPTKTTLTSASVTQTAAIAVANARASLTAAESGSVAAYTVRKKTVKKVVRKRVVKRRAKKVVKKVVRKTVTAAAVKSPAEQLIEAQSVLDGLKARYPRYLDGVTVTVGDTPGGYQAVAYYSSGRIIVNPNHVATIDRLLAHEIWHVIDWRDNGRIDWRENIPPVDAAAFLG
jgi:hypothetical protein